MMDSPGTDVRSGLPITIAVQKFVPRLDACRPAVSNRVSMQTANATSSIVALGVVGMALLIAGVLMLRAAIRARIAYRKARRTYRRGTGTVIGNKAQIDEETTVYCPIVEIRDPRRTFSPPMFASTKFVEGREVAVLCHPRGREPILDERPFRGGFAGGCLFLIIAVACTVCGMLAIYAVI